MAAIKCSKRKMLARYIVQTNTESQFRNHFNAIIRATSEGHSRQMHTYKNLKLCNFVYSFLGYTACCSVFWSGSVGGG